MNQGQEHSQSVKMGAYGRESWLTRSWRPLLMLALMAYMAFCGFGLPMAELLAGHRLDFRPRWDLIPKDLWPLLTFGVSGYIGGRTLEKLAGAAPRRPASSPGNRNP